VRFLFSLPFAAVSGFFVLHDPLSPATWSGIWLTTASGF